MKINKEKFTVLLAENCLTMSKLAEMTGIEKARISKINKGFANFRPITVGKIARALNIPVEELIEE